jgi:hypothetical protein
MAPESIAGCPKNNFFFAFLMLVFVLWVGLIPEKWTVEKCSSAQVKGAEGNEEKSVQ